MNCVYGVVIIMISLHLSVDNAFENKASAAMRALASYESGPGSIPWPAVMHGSGLLVLYSAQDLRGFSPGTPVFGRGVESKGSIIEGSEESYLDLLLLFRLAIIAHFWWIFSFHQNQNPLFDLMRLFLTCRYNTLFTLGFFGSSNELISPSI